MHVLKNKMLLILRKKLYLYLIPLNFHAIYVIIVLLYCNHANTKCNLKGAGVGIDHCDKK